MKKLVIVSILSILFANQNFHTDFDKLIGTRWKVYKTLEIFHQDTTIYKELSHINEEGNKVTQVNQLGGYIEFTNDSTGLFCGFKGRLVKLDSINIEIIPNQAEKYGKKPYFFGKLMIRELTDTTATLVKNISRNGKWTREFYLKKYK